MEEKLIGKNVLLNLKDSHKKKYKQITKKAKVIGYWYMGMFKVVLDSGEYDLYHKDNIIKEV